MSDRELVFLLSESQCSHQQDGDKKQSFSETGDKVGRHLVRTEYVLMIFPLTLSFHHPLLRLASFSQPQAFLSSSLLSGDSGNYGEDRDMA